MFFRLCTVVVVLSSVAPVRAHFIWITPDGADAARAKVVFSESLEPDESVPVDKIASAKLFRRGADDKVVSIDWKKGDGNFLVTLPGKDAVVVGGVCRFGVLKRGAGKPFLLSYYPKLIRGPAVAQRPWDKLALEIVPLGGDRFQVVFQGKPADGEEVVVLTPDGGEKKLKCDAKGEFGLAAARAGVYGLRVRRIEAKAGEQDGEKYEEVRHYATLVFEAAAKSAGKVGPERRFDFAPSPQAVSSFGAAVADGRLYVYGGHCARTHQYSTEAVTGSFRRLKLSDPGAWEELPAGPALQGLALVAHGGKIYRIGGMQPRNRPGEPADNHSVATVARFDPAVGKWEDLPDLPAGRSSHDAAVVGDMIVVVGGWRLNGAGREADWHDTTLVLDLSQTPLKWRSVRQPFERRALAVAASGGKVYVGGGIGSDDDIRLSVDVYDPIRDVWTAGPNLPGPARNGFAPAAAALGGRVYVNLADGRTVRLNEGGDAWSDVGRLRVPRIVHRLVAAERQEMLVVVGGASKDGNVAAAEVVLP